MCECVQFIFCLRLNTHTWSPLEACMRATVSLHIACCAYFVYLSHVLLCMHEFVRTVSYLVHSSQVYHVFDCMYEYPFVCVHVPLCVSHYFVCACPSECLLGCVRMIAWVYLVLYISVCFYHISCVYECVYRLLCVFCVRRIVLFVCAHNGMMTHSTWCECGRARTNDKCVCELIDFCV